MKAPKKVYRTTTYLDSDRGKTVWKNKPVPGAENVEYIRTDALIENVCDAYCKVCGHYTHSVPTNICRLACGYFKDFKKDIKRRIIYENE